MPAADGTVRIVKYNCNVTASGTVIGYGNYVAIEHDNGMWTVYAHLSAAGVSVGQRVKKGQVIGLIGNTGGSTGNHLHVEYRQGGFKGEVIDPYQDNATSYGLCTPPGGIYQQRYIKQQLTNYAGRRERKWFRTRERRRFCRRA